VKAQPTLFEIAPDRQSRRAEQRDRISELKAKHGIFTQNAPSDGKPNWLAFSLPFCVEALKSYNLSDAEKTEPLCLYAGYCRLMEEQGMLVDGAETEAEAVLETIKRLEAFDQ
jgi:hypothetical protein